MYIKGAGTVLQKPVQELLKISSFLNDLHIPTLSEDQKKFCEGKISAEECFRLLDSFDNNKTPGNDGIPIEFYKTFWPVISDSFMNYINECFEKGEMSRMPSLQNVLDRFRIVLVPYIGSANPSFCTKCIIWSFIQTMPFIKFIKLFYNNWKIIFLGLQKEPNTS